MRTIKFLEGKQIYLRPFKENDLELVEFGKNNPDVRETLFLFAPMTTEQVKAELNQWSSSKEIMLFTICRQQDDVAVGQTALVRIDYVSRAAFFMSPFTIHNFGLKDMAAKLPE